jgi:ATP-binding cassette subfamily B protein
VESVCREVGFDEFVRNMPAGYDSGVRERGATLSTGQKQLLSFARALAFDPEILVLDEATANIDTTTELKVQAAVAKLCAGRTSMVIAHRLSTIQQASKILVIHHGHLAEEGTHEELLARDGLYRKLYDLQYREVPAGA